MTIANLITIGRLLAVPLLVYALVHQFDIAALALFVIAGVSDAADGYVARHFDQESELGVWLDPIADKLLMFSTYVFLGIMGHIPDWLVILVVSRDALIVGAVVLSSLMGRPVPLAPSMISKVTTVVQVALAAVVLYALAFEWQVGSAIYVLSLVTAGLTVVSGAAYLLRWMRHLSGTRA